MEKIIFQKKSISIFIIFFIFKSGRTLEFSDLRKFGKIILADTEKIREIKEIKRLGSGCDE